MTINVNIAGALVWAAAVAFGISGANTVAPFDVPTPPSATGNGKVASVSITTSNANDLIIGAVGIWYPVPPLLQGVGFTLIATQTSTNLETSAEYRIVSTPQTGLPVSYDWSTYPYPSDWAMIADAVKKAP
jgi:hypothetical protein